MILLAIARAWAWVRRDPVVALLVFFGLVIGGQAVAIRHLRGWLADAQIDALNANARADISANVARIDSTKLATATRQLVQARVRADSLDTRLHLTPVATARVELVMPPTSIHATADSVVHRDSARLLTFDLRHAPITGHADVAVPDDPAQPPVIRLAIALDTAEITTAFGCVGDTARVLFSAPPWLPLRITGGEQDPRVCAHVAPAIDPPHARKWGATVGPAMLTDATGAAQNGLGATIGWKPAPWLTIGPTALVDAHAQEHHGLGVTGGWSPF